MNDGTKDLLKIHERLEENLPDSQTYQVLDQLVFTGVKPVMVGTTFFDQVIAELLPRVINNARRKYSNVQRGKLIDLLYSTVLANDPLAKLRALRACRIERTVLFGSLDKFLKTTDGYTRLCADYYAADSSRSQSELRQQMLAIERSVGHVRGSLLTTVRWAQHGFDLAHTFRQMILEKYVRLAFNEAVKQSKMTEAHVDREQLFKNLLISVVKAIDKFDPDKGTLTSYVRWWFMDGVNQSNNTHEVDIAFTVPNAVRREMILKAGGNVNFTIPLDDVLDLADTSLVSADDGIRERQERAFSSRLLREIDGDGMATLALGVPYALSDAEMRRMRETMTRSSSRP